MSNSSWILGKFSLDFLFFILPGLVTFALLPQIDNADIAGGIICAFLITGILDGGHVYTTIWRTWLDPEERKRYRGYYLVPLFTFLIIIIWSLLRIPYFWTMLTYFTIYHNYRQFYGFTKWYEKLNRRKCQFSGLIVQALCMVPFILFHFRTGVGLGYMTNRDVLFFPMPEVFSKAMEIEFALLSVWVILELDLVVRKKIFEPNRILSIFIPALLYGYGFLRGETFIDIVYPLLAAHAVAYFGAMSLSMERLNPKKYSFLGALKAILITAGMFGTFDYFCENTNIIPDTSFIQNNLSLGASVAIAIIVTPVICHFIFDSWIWRYHHPMAKTVYSRS